MTDDVEAAIEHGRAAFLRACELDVAVQKPGNVSVASAGHGMDAALFITAAKAAAEPLFARGKRVGARIEDAVAASYAASGCNANLGIVLLCAPLAVARERAPAARTVRPLRTALERVLEGLDIEDARASFRAIAHANPGGLGRVAAHDVRDVPSIDLRAAMREAAGRDSIARQYANGYADVFDVGLPLFRRAARAAPERGVLAVYLAYLRGWPDSHVARKHGPDVARALSLEAVRRSAAEAAGELRPDDIAAWDADLKFRGINPGTSADLAVATVFVAGCVDGD